VFIDLKEASDSILRHLIELELPRKLAKLIEMYIHSDLV